MGRRLVRITPEECEDAGLVFEEIKHQNPAALFTTVELVKKKKKQRNTSENDAAEEESVPYEQAANFAPIYQGLARTLRKDGIDEAGRKNDNSSVEVWKILTRESNGTYLEAIITRAVNEVRWKLGIFVTSWYYYSTDSAILSP